MLVPSLSRMPDSLLVLTPKFTDVNFFTGKWTGTGRTPCYGSRPNIGFLPRVSRSMHRSARTTFGIPNTPSSPFTTDRITAAANINRSASGATRPKESASIASISSASVPRCVYKKCAPSLARGFERLILLVTSTSSNNPCTKSRRG